MVNVNKLFPRLSIRHKLAIAFAGVALVPLLVVTVFGAASSARQIDLATRSTVAHDLRLAETLTSSELAASERHVAFLAQAELGPALVRPGVEPDHGADLAMTQLVATEPSLFRVKLIDADGRERLTVSADGVDRKVDHVGRGTFYAWRGEALAPGDRALIPVELASAAGDSGTIAAIAILVPVRDPAGEYAGVVVGEAYAARILSGLDAATPGYGGVTALVDGSGLFLYHSVRKRNWSRLLADRERVDMSADLSPEIAAQVLQDSTGAIRAADASLVSYRRMSLGGHAPGAVLSLYRIVDSSTLHAPVRRFLRWVLVGGTLVVLVVIGVAVIAGEQLTRPIRRIQDAMWRLARGEPGSVPAVDTNDEIEDLARDFRVVGLTIEAHRSRQADLLTDRTHALAVTHAELTGIVEHSTDAIIGTDAAGRVRLWNVAAGRLFGYPADDALGRDVVSLLSGPTGTPPDDQRFIDAELVRSGFVHDFRTVRFDREGAPIPVSLSQATVRGADGRVAGYSMIVRDRRSQEMLDDQMRRSERLAATSVVAASVAHEINNPLGVVANRIELMQRDLARGGDDRTRLAKDLAVLLDHVRRASAVTSDLLRFARDDAGAAGPVNVASVLTRLCELLRRPLASRGIRLEHAPSPVTGDLVGHEKAIEAVVLNLMLNAADATPPGGTVRLSLRVPAGAQGAEILVEDSGPGVPEHLRERVFEPFFTTKAPGHGTGLGLTVCRSIVERTGGAIVVGASDLGGAAFVVRLPRVAVRGAA